MFLFREVHNNILRPSFKWYGQPNADERSEQHFSSSEVTLAMRIRRASRHHSPAFGIRAPQRILITPTELWPISLEYDIWKK
jgi:hypothetical protein